MRKALILIFLLSASIGYSQTAEDEFSKAYQQLTDGVDVDVVMQTLQSCIDKDKNFMEAYLLRAFIYYKLEDYRAAIEDYDLLLKLFPNHLEGLKKRAFTKIQVLDYQGAIDDHTKRIELQPNNAVAYFDRAYCHGLLDRNDLAIVDYSKAIELDNQYTSAYKNRGIALINQFLLDNNSKEPSIDEAEEACDDFARALHLCDSGAKDYIFKYCLGE
jgi:tetratricopeptide (TPR) repeat protein